MLTETQMQQAVSLFSDGKSPEEVASALGVSRATLTSDMLGAGYKIDRKITWFLKPVKPMASVAAAVDQLTDREVAAR